MKSARAKRPAPARPNSEKWRKIQDWSEKYPVAMLVKDSYVLSRTWAWASRIRLSPKVSIPIPRFLSHRDE